MITDNNIFFLTMCGVRMRMRHLEREQNCSSNSDEKTRRSKIFVTLVNKICVGCALPRTNLLSVRTGKWIFRKKTQTVQKVR